MCRLNAGLQDELDALYPHEDRNQTKMMDRALSMLLYNEYVPMPMTVAPTLCPNLTHLSSSNSNKGFEPSPLSMLNSATTCMFKHDDYSQNVINRKVSDLTSTFSQATLEDGMIDKSELSGWDVSMSPIQEPLSTSPPRQILFLNDAEHRTLFLGREHCQDVIKYVKNGMLEPRYPAAAVFIRSLSPAEPIDPALSWSNLAENDADVDSEWVIA